MSCSAAVCLSFRQFVAVIGIVAILTSIPAALVIEIALAFLKKRFGISVVHDHEVSVGDTDDDSGDS